MTRKPSSKLKIQDESGRVICNAAELNERVTHDFGRQFSDPRVMELPAFTGVPSPLTMPITPVEVHRAISGGRACGHDDLLPADLLKSTADLIVPSIAEIFNDALEHHEPLDIVKGVLILRHHPPRQAPRGVAVILDEPELRTIRFLLAAMSLEPRSPRLSTGDCHAFTSTLGTPQCYSLSPVLYTIYLEAALRDLHSRIPPRPRTDDRLPLDVGSRCTSPSTPATDHRYPLATPFLERRTLPTYSIQPLLCRYPRC